MNTGPLLQDAMDQWFSGQDKDAFGVFAGVVFHDDTSYDIRTLFSKSAGTDSLIGAAENCRVGSKACPAGTYLTNGFLELQTAIDGAILSRYNITSPQYSTQMMPHDKFPGDSSYIRSFAPVFYVFAYSFFIQVSD